MRFEIAEQPMESKTCPTHGKCLKRLIKNQEHTDSFCDLQDVIHH